MKILQITTALPGWYAEFEVNEEVYSLPIAVWAIVEDDGTARVTSFSPGDSAEMEIPDDYNESFFGWSYKAKNPALP